MRRLYRLPLIVKIVLVLAVIILAIFTAGSIVVAMMNPGPEQPVPFSHRIHAGQKRINCFFCHPNAGRSRNAGIPPVEKCILCHKVIASQWEPIARDLSYYAQNKPIPWVRVNKLPDFVEFSHEPHIARGFDCSVCHGNVAASDRLKPTNFDMKFCTDCHWKNKFSVSCFICHY